MFYNKLYKDKKNLVEFKDIKEKLDNLKRTQTMLIPPEFAICDFENNTHWGYYHNLKYRWLYMWCYTIDLQLYKFCYRCKVYIV